MFHPLQLAASTLTSFMHPHNLCSHKTGSLSHPRLCLQGARLVNSRYGAEVLHVRTASRAPQWFIDRIWQWRIWLDKRHYYNNGPIEAHRYRRFNSSHVPVRHGQPDHLLQSHCRCSCQADANAMSTHCRCFGICRDLAASPDLRCKGTGKGALRFLTRRRADVTGLACPVSRGAFGSGLGTTHTRHVRPGSSQLPQ